jgi:hypothetical protein
LSFDPESVLFSEVKENGLYDTAFLSWM